MMKNKFKGYCSVCNVVMSADTGWVIKKENRWVKYCDECVPNRKTRPVRCIKADGTLFMPYEPQHYDLLRSFPGFHKETDAFGKFLNWKVSTKLEDRMRVLEIASKLELEVDPSLKEIPESEQTKIAKESGLYPYQINGVRWLSLGNKRFLGDEMGLGKSVQLLFSIPKKGRTIVVMPAGIKYNWLDECQKWRPDLKPIVLNGKDSFQIPKESEVVMINFDILPDWLVPVKRKDSWDYDIFCASNIKEALKDVILIVDEAQKLKNYKTNKSQRVKGLSLLCQKTWGATGTPLMNYPQDLFGVLDSLNMSYEVFHGWKNFVTLMNGCPNQWGGYEWGTPSEAVPELLRKVMLRRTREEVLPDLPSKTYTDIIVDLPTELQGECDSLWEKYKDLINNQVLPSFREMASIRAKLATSKTITVLEMISDHEEDGIPLIVFSAHIEVLKIIGLREGWGLIIGETPPEERQNIVRRFQNGELLGIAASIQAAGVGTTLTRAWKCIFIDHDWTPANNNQAADRLCRIGQTSDKIEIVRLISNHPLDRHVQNLLFHKEVIAKAAIDAKAEVCVPKSDIQEETEEEFQARMARLNSIKKVIVKGDTAWTNQFAKDPEIPF